VPSREATRPTPIEIDVAVRAGRADRLVRWAARARGVADRRFLITHLERALLHSDPGAVSERVREQARALGVDPGLLVDVGARLPSNAVLVPLVADETGEGFLRWMYVTYVVAAEEPDGVELDPRARATVTRAIGLAARQAGHTRTQQHLTLAAVQPGGLTGMRLTGTSHGAAAYVSALALWTGRAVRRPTAITGALEGARVVGVGGMPAKLEAALSGRADVALLVVPPSERAQALAALRAGRSRAELCTPRDLDALADAVLAPEAKRPPDPEAEVARVRAELGGAWTAFRWPELRAPLEKLAGEMPRGRPDLHVQVLTMLAAARRHLGAPEASHALLERATRLAAGARARRAVPDGPLAYLHMQRAMTLQKLGRSSEAARDAARAVAIARRARLRGDLLKALGCAGLVETSRGRHARAVGLFREALVLTHEHRPHACTRSHAYLIQALGRSGDLAGARREHRVATRHLPDGPPDRRASDEAWLAASFAEALGACERWRDVVRLLDLPAVRAAIEGAPLPGLDLRRLLGLALVRTGAAGEGFELLASSTVTRGVALDSHLGFLAHVAVLVEAEERLACAMWNDDIAGRARAALVHVPRYGALPRFLGPSLRAVERGLGRPGPALRRALGRLVARCLSLV